VSAELIALAVFDLLEHPPQDRLDEAVASLLGGTFELHVERVQEQHSGDAVGLGITLLLSDQVEAADCELLDVEDRGRLVGGDDGLPSGGPSPGENWPIGECASSPGATLSATYVTTKAVVCRTSEEAG
jgi:hypothetical protein